MRAARRWRIDGPRLLRARPFLDAMSTETALA